MMYLLKVFQIAFKINLICQMIHEKLQIIRWKVMTYCCLLKRTFMYKTREKKHWIKHFNIPMSDR